MKGAQLLGFLASRPVVPPSSLGSSACLSEHDLHSWSCSVARLLQIPRSDWARSMAL
jgi:hypothetical protein